MTLEDLVWSKHHWERMCNGGAWAIPNACVVMERTPKGFSLSSVMPFEAVREAADQGMNVPKTPAQLLAYQRERFNYIKKYFETAGLDFDDPKGLLRARKGKKK
jgi:hypothetical protein